MSLGVILLLGLLLAPELTWLRTCGLGLLLVGLTCWAYGAGLATLFGRRRFGEVAVDDGGLEPAPLSQPARKSGNALQRNAAMRRMGSPSLWSFIRYYQSFLRSSPAATASQISTRPRPVR